MQKMVCISFDASDIPGGAAAILRAAECGPEVSRVNDVPVLKQIFVDVDLAEADERVSKLLALLEKYGEKYQIIRRVEFTEEERQAAPLISPSYYGDTVFAGPMFGTKYDMTNACPTCGTGARQISPLFIDYDSLPRIKKNRAIQATGGSLLVNAAIEKKLLEAGITGISFGEVYVRLKNKERVLVPRKQILISHVMPPLPPINMLTDDRAACKTCRRAGMRTPPDVRVQTFYRREDLIHSQDFNLSWEWFGDFRYDGNVKKAHFATPMKLVTPRVMNIFREAGAKNFNWIPLAVDE